MEIGIRNLVDDERRYETARGLRWPHCGGPEAIKRGRDDKAGGRQRYECKGCGKRFDDRTNPVFSGRHQPLTVWVIFPYFLGLNLSTRRIAQELNLHKADARHMAAVLRSGVAEKKPETVLSGAGECDAVYVVAGRQGQPEEVKKRTGRDDATG